MKIALFHGYELIGSGSNEYNRYLAQSFIKLGHQVCLICRETQAERFSFIDKLVQWDSQGRTQTSQLREGTQCVMHYIPYGNVYPVYLTDKQRQGNVKSFSELSDQELDNFIALNEHLLDLIIALEKPDVVYANHLVMQPYLALQACSKHAIPLGFFLHGSAIEYTVRNNPRYLSFAAKAIDQCDFIVSGNTEVRNRLLGLFPQQQTLTELFKPVDKKQRKQQCQNFIDQYCAQASQGKSPALHTQLQTWASKHDLAAIKDQFNQYQENDLDTDCAEKLLKLNFDQPILLFVGALTAGKGLQSCLCAMSLLFEREPGAQLLIIGSGAYREILETLIHSLTAADKTLLQHLSNHGFDLDRNQEQGPWLDVQAFLQKPEGFNRLFQYGERLAKQVTFLGRMNHAQMAYIFPLADIAIFPSARHEAYGLVLMESLACGVLPLVSYFSGFKQGIDDLNGFLDANWVDCFKINMDNELRIESIAEQLRKLIDLSRSTDVGPVLARLAQSRYDWKQKAKQLIALFTTIQEQGALS